MRFRILVIFFLFFVSVFKGRSQEAEGDVSKSLEKLFTELGRNITDTERNRVNDSILMILDSYTKSDTIFTHRFSGIRNLGQITSPDSLVKIVTWNLLVRASPSRYYTYIIKRSEKGGENMVYRLSADYREEQISCDSFYTANNWYGALYYDIRPCFFDDSQAWVILGIDYGNMNISRKLIDVLSFTSDSTIVLGKKWFQTDKEVKYRDVFEYASNATMSLRFASNHSIVFDHLVPFSPSQIGNREYYGPDYSYDAYSFKDGLWIMTINVDARNKE